MWSGVLRGAQEITQAVPGGSPDTHASGGRSAVESQSVNGISAAMWSTGKPNAHQEGVVE